MRSTALAVVVGLGACGPASAFDFAPEHFGERYNDAASAWGYVDRIYPGDCLVPAPSAICYRFSRGAGAVLTPAKDPDRTKSIEYFFAMGGSQVGGLKFAPWITARLVFPAFSHEIAADILATVGPDRLQSLGGGQSIVRREGVAVMGEFFPKSRVWHLKFDDERVAGLTP